MKIRPLELVQTSKFNKKTLDIFCKLWFNIYIKLDRPYQRYRPFPVTGGDPGNVSVPPTDKGLKT